jgi:hypothetical protein
MHMQFETASGKHTDLPWLPVSVGTNGLCTDDDARLLLGLTICFTETSALGLQCRAARVPIVLSR